ncbi:MAG: Na/Pi cotransporter family protein [Bacteroidales bacterium]|nr:Na/Pi cotransporter family protein [Bacteroidales bacterium]
MSTILQILTLLGAVTLFLFGLSMLSNGLQKVAGDGMRRILAAMTSNPFKQILTGIGVTALIQSSTATTIMVVGFVNAGLLELGQAIGVIMGANIGTTITAWIMAVFGFSFNMADFAYPLLLLGYILLQMKKSQKRRNTGEIIIGFALFFIGFAALRSTAQQLITPEQLGFLASWSNLGWWSILVFMIIGIVLTACFQSSAATMAITMILITTGVVDFRLATAIIMGGNIGATIAANIAASVGNTAAKRTALSHTIMNTVGVIFVLIIYPWFLQLIGWMVELFGLPDPNTVDLAANLNTAAVQTSLLYSVCVMHTLFNVVITLIFVWFVPQFANLLCKIFPPKNEEEEYRLLYISGGPLSTAELSLDEAKQEISNFCDVCYKGFGHIRAAVNETQPEKFADRLAKLVKYEEITDKIEYEIAYYLNEVSKGEISSNSAKRIKAMYKIIGEMESLGDSGESISRILKRANAHNRHFDKDMIERLNMMMDKVGEAYLAMKENLSYPYHQLKEINNAKNAETRINLYRDQLRDEHINNIENPEYNYQTGVYYMDIVAELERMGDFIINVSEAILEEKEG